jgi:hypothetical protein
MPDRHTAAAEQGGTAMSHDTEWTDEPVCPHCGKVQGDAWEWGDDECGETECGSCEKSFHYTRYVSINWSTKPVKEDQP